MKVGVGVGRPDLELADCKVLGWFQSPAEAVA